MTEDDAAKIMNELVDRMMADLTAEAFGWPTTPNRLAAITYRHGRFETVEIDGDGKIVEPPPRCPKCGPVLLCFDHMLMIT
jgi:hypothetical protein